MWDGAGGASRAGWERPGAPARGGTAARCSPPRRACIGPGLPRPSRDPAAAPSPRTSCTLHRATCILYSLLNTVHFAPSTLHYMPLTMYALLCTAPRTLYHVPPHPARARSILNTVHPVPCTPCTMQRRCLCMIRTWPQALLPSRPGPNTNSGGLVQTQTPHTNSPM